MSSEYAQQDQPLPNPALEDIKLIETSRPELSAAEWEIVSKASDFIKATLRPEVRMELETENIKWRAEFEEAVRKETQQVVAKSMEEWRKEQEPLSKEELSTLLNQEYVEFKVPIRAKYDDHNSAFSTRDFTIAELPSSVEERFLKEAQKSLIPLIEQTASMDWNLTGALTDKLRAMLDRSPEVLKVAAELVAICLDPWSTDSKINGTWVFNNLSTTRIWNILNAQSEANKYRDFFSSVFRSFQTRKILRTEVQSPN